MRIISISKKLSQRKEKDEEDEELIMCSLMKLAKAFQDNPNFKTNKHDWEAHYNASKDIIDAYEKANKKLIKEIDAVEFLSNLNKHIETLEEIFESNELN